MLYWEIIAVCSQIHTKHINTLCGQNGELLNVKICSVCVCVCVYIYIYIVTIGLYSVNTHPNQFNATQSEILTASLNKSRPNSDTSL